MEVTPKPQPPIQKLQATVTPEVKKAAKKPDRVLGEHLTSRPLANNEGLAALRSKLNSQEPKKTIRRSPKFRKR